MIQPRAFRPAPQACAALGAWRPPALLLRRHLHVAAAEMRRPRDAARPLVRGHHVGEEAAFRGDHVAIHHHDVGQQAFAHGEPLAAAIDEGPVALDLTHDGDIGACARAEMPDRGIGQYLRRGGGQRADAVGEAHAEPDELVQPADQRIVEDAEVVIGGEIAVHVGPDRIREDAFLHHLAGDAIAEIDAMAEVEEDAFGLGIEQPVRHVLADAHDAVRHRRIDVRQHIAGLEILHDLSHHHRRVRPVGLVDREQLAGVHVERQAGGASRLGGLLEHLRSPMGEAAALPVALDAAHELRMLLRDPVKALAIDHAGIVQGGAFHAAL